MEIPWKIIFCKWTESMSDQPEPVVILWGRKYLRCFSIKFCQWSCQRGRSSVIAEDKVPSAAGIGAVWLVRTYWGSSVCGDSVRRGLRSWQGGTGIHNNTARVVFYCSELTLTLFVFIVGAFFGLYFLICKVGVGITGLHKKWILMM